MTSTPSASIDPDAGTTEFVDTNVLLYAHDATETVKQPLAIAALERLWTRRTGVLSTQVLQEFYSVAITRRRPPLDAGFARHVVGLYSVWSVVTVQPDTILAASRLAERHRIAFWDALIVEAARVAGAARLLTEDLNHGQVIDGVTVVNPFADAAG